MEAYLSAMLKEIKGLKPSQVNISDLRISDFPWNDLVDNYLEKLNLIGIECDDFIRSKIVSNYILRDLIFLHLATSERCPLGLNDVNFPSSGFSVEERTLYLGSHDFFQVITPILLSLSGSSIFPFVDSVSNIKDSMLKAMMANVYRTANTHLSGGYCLEASPDNWHKLKVCLEEIFHSGCSIYAAIDQFGNFMKVREQGIIKGEYGHYHLVTGAISHAIAMKYRIKYVKVIFKDGRYQVHTRVLPGESVEEICTHYVEEIEHDLKISPEGWEGILRLVPYVAK